jgi:hypothetical protein
MKNAENIKVHSKKAISLEVELSRAVSLPKIYALMYLEL